jgi:hypothetical protein
LIKLLRFFLVGLAIMTVATFTLSLLDDAFIRTGMWYQDILTSISYYTLWVLPYWWLLILLGSITIAVIVYCLHFLFRSKENKSSLK